MNANDIQITFVGMEPTDAIKKYCIEKISKYEHLWKEATSIEVTLKEYVNSRGVKNDFRVDINIKLPNSLVRVEVSGEDMYANVDEATDTMARRLKRYHERRSYWEGATPWRVLEADSLKDDLVEDVEHLDYANYVPKIAVRKKLEDLSPIEEAEAIERMELSGYDQIMFRNKATGKLSMIYRREQGGYGLVEPGDTPLD
jgi:putative sigma-54 modulation protein